MFRIRWHFVIYFCVHTGHFAGKTLQVVRLRLTAKHLVTLNFELHHPMNFPRSVAFKVGIVSRQTSGHRRFQSRDQSLRRAIPGAKPAQKIPHSV